MRNVAQAGLGERLAAATPELIAACEQTTDADLIMDVARQLDRAVPGSRDTALNLHPWTNPRLRYL